MKQLQVFGGFKLSLVSVTTGTGKRIDEGGGKEKVLRVFRREQARILLSHVSEGEMTRCLFALLRLANLMLTDVGDGTAMLLLSCHGLHF